MLGCWTSCLGRGGCSCKGGGGAGTKVQVGASGPGMPFTDDDPKGPKSRLCLIIRERLRRARDKGAGRHVGPRNAVHG